MRPEDEISLGRRVVTNHDTLGSIQEETQAVDQHFINYGVSHQLVEQYWHVCLVSTYGQDKIVQPAQSPYQTQV